MDIKTLAESLHYTKDYWIIALPAIMALADVITGFLQAQINGTKDSAIMRKGLYRKLGEIGAIMLTFVVCTALGFGNTIPTFASLYIALMEILSIFENLQLAGVPIPTFVTNKAKKISEEIDNLDV